MTRHQTTAPMPCPVCDSRRYDDDLAFADGTGYVCPSCDSNVFTDDDTDGLAATAMTTTDTKAILAVQDYGQNGISLQVHRPGCEHASIERAAQVITLGSQVADVRRAAAEYGWTGGVVAFMDCLIFGTPT